MRDIIASLRRGVVPAAWRAQYSTRSAQSLGEWIADLAARATALMKRYTPLQQQSSSSSSSIKDILFWIGGMFTPEAFITATRQQTAQVRKRIQITAITT